MKTSIIRFEKMNSRTTRWYEMTLNSGHPYGDYNQEPYLTFRGFDYVIELKLPFLKYVLKGVDVDYGEECERSYGFSIFEDHMSIRYGIQSGSSKLDQRYGFTLPWLDSELVRRSILLPDYSVYINDVSKLNYDEQEEVEKSIPSKMFYIFTEDDGTGNSATAFITEGEWRVGRSKWWKWLRLFKKPEIHRYLNIEFEQEAGKERGSWKGGVLSMRLHLERLQTPLDAFKKWASKENITNIQRIL